MNPYNVQHAVFTAEFYNLNFGNLIQSHQNKPLSFGSSFVHCRIPDREYGEAKFFYHDVFLPKLDLVSWLLTGLTT